MQLNNKTQKANSTLNHEWLLLFGENKHEIMWQKRTEYAYNS